MSKGINYKHLKTETTFFSFIKLKKKKFFKHKFK